MSKYEGFHNSATAETLDSPEDAQAHADQMRSIGITLLARAGFDGKHPIVEKSFDRARKRGEKFSGSNSERRVTAHLERIERIDEHGGEASRQLWERAKEHVNLPDDPEQRAKAEATLQEYTDFFSSEDCPFPTWFKVYAWDGLTSLKSTSTQKDGIYAFQKRDKSSQADFPVLDTAALALTFDTIADHFGLPTLSNDEKELSPTESQLVDKIMTSGSFNMIYSYELTKHSKPVEVPENPEDVHGVWREYSSVEDVEAISNAAKGTPWCIKSKYTTANYLGVRVGEDGNDYISEDCKAKFILFHLTDPKTGLPSKQACASIRLNRDGEIAEISGIVGGGEGQRLNDSLVEMVRDKAAQYPGFEQHRATFEDTIKIIQISNAHQNDEPFTPDEIAFITSPKLHLESLHHTEDPRIRTLSAAAAEQVLTIVSDSSKSEQERRQFFLAEHDTRLLFRHLDEILADGVMLKPVLGAMGKRDIERHYDLLKAAGASDELLQRLIATKYF